MNNILDDVTVYLVGNNDSSPIKINGAKMVLDKLEGELTNCLQFSSDKEGNSSLPSVFTATSFISCIKINGIEYRAIKSVHYENSNRYGVYIERK